MTLAEIVRRTLDAYLADVYVDPSEAIAATFGADPTPGLPTETNGPMPDVLVDTDLFIDHLRGAAELKPGMHGLHYSVITCAADGRCISPAAEPVTRR